MCFLLPPPPQPPDSRLPQAHKPMHPAADPGRLRLSPSDLPCPPLPAVLPNSLQGRGPASALLPLAVRREPASYSAIGPQWGAPQPRSQLGKDSPALTPSRGHPSIGGDCLLTPLPRTPGWRPQAPLWEPGSPGSPETGGNRTNPAAVQGGTHPQPAKGIPCPRGKPQWEGRHKLRCCQGLRVLEARPRLLGLLEAAVSSQGHITLNSPDLV